VALLLLLWFTLLADTLLLQLLLWVLLQGDSSCWRSTLVCLLLRRAALNCLRCLSSLLLLRLPPPLLFIVLSLMLLR
jgi:hypothetical protein